MFVSGLMVHWIARHDESCCDLYRHAEVHSDSSYFNLVPDSYTFNFQFLPGKFCSSLSSAEFIFIFANHKIVSGVSKFNVSETVL